MLTALALSLLSPHAVAADAPEADASWSHIVNGDEIGTNRFESAVAIGIDIEYGGQQYRQSTCSASLITDQMLLTAGHCTAEFGVPVEQLAEVGAAFFTDSVYGGSRYPVAGFTEIVNHPGYDGNGSAGGGPLNDVGVIILDEPIDSETARPTWFADAPMDDEKVLDQTVTSVGWGITSYSSQNSGGVKRMARLTIDEVDDQFLYSYNRTNPDGSGVCSGDSGGPQYRKNADGTWTQWGIHSFVFGASDPCLAASGSTRVDQFSNFVLRQVENVHGTTDRCELTGLYDDRICQSDCAEPDPDCLIDVDGDGLVSDEEFDAADRDADGFVDERELLKIGAACNSSGANPAWLPLLGLLGLGVRRRRD